MKPLSPAASTHPDRPLRIGLTVLPVLMVVGYWLPPTWLWGLNHANWLPWPVRLGLPLACLVVTWTAVGQRFGRWLVERLDPVLPGRPLVAYGLVPVFGTAFFWLSSEATHLLGDGQTLVVVLTKGHLFHGFDGLTYHLLARMCQMIGGGKPEAFGALALVSYASGALYLVAAAWSARRLAAPGAERILLYALLVLGTPVQVFAGYAEVYAPLCVAMLVFLSCFLLFLRGRGGLLAVSVAWSAAVLLHLNALFLAPLLVVAWLWPTAEGTVPWRRRLPVLVGPPVIAVAVFVALYLIAGYDLAAIRADFGQTGGAGGIFRTWRGPNGLLVWRHGKDVLNLVLLLAPVPVVLLLTAGLKGQDGRVRATAKVLLAGSAWLMLLMVAVHLKLGTVRDWDLFAPHVSLVAVTGWLLATTSARGVGKGPAGLGALVGVALLSLLPWLAVNSDEGRMVSRLEAVAADMPPYPQGLLHEQMAYHFELPGRMAATEKHFRRAAEICPGNLRFLGIYGHFLLRQGEVERAIKVFDQALAADSLYVDGLEFAITARTIGRHFASVLPLARRLERLGGQDGSTAEAHGMAAEQTGHLAEAVSAYRRAVALDPARIRLLDQAGRLALQGEDAGSAEAIFRAMLEANPGQTAATYNLAVAIWMGYRTQPGLVSPTETRSRLLEVRDLIARVLVDPAMEPAGAENLRRWQAEVDTALSGLAE